MKLFFSLILTSFLLIPTSFADTEPIIYYGTCNMYIGSYSSSKAPEYDFYLTTQGQVRPSWPLRFPGNPHRFRISYLSWDIYTITDEDSPEIHVEQDIHDGQPLDIRYEDPMSGWSVRCVKTGLP